MAQAAAAVELAKRYVASAGRVAAEQGTPLGQKRVLAAGSFRALITLTATGEADAVVVEIQNLGRTIRPEPLVQAQQRNP